MFFDCPWLLLCTPWEGELPVSRSNGLVQISTTDKPSPEPLPTLSCAMLSSHVASNCVFLFPAGTHMAHDGKCYEDSLFKRRMEVATRVQSVVDALPDGADRASLDASVRAAVVGQFRSKVPDREQCFQALLHTLIDICRVRRGSNTSVKDDWVVAFQCVFDENDVEIEDTDAQPVVHPHDPVLDLPPQERATVLNVRERERGETIGWVACATRLDLVVLCAGNPSTVSESACDGRPTDRPPVWVLWQGDRSTTSGIESKGSWSSARPTLPCWTVPPGCLLHPSTAGRGQSPPQWTNNRRPSAPARPSQTRRYRWRRNRGRSGRTQGHRHHRRPWHRHNGVHNPRPRGPPQRGRCRS